MKIDTEIYFKRWTLHSNFTRPHMKHFLSLNISVSSVQSLSRVQLFATPWTAACQASLSITSSQNLLKLMPIELVMPSNHLILSSPSPPVFNLSQHQGLFQWVSSLHQVAKVLEFSFNTSPSNEYSGFPLGWTGWISLQSKGLSRVFSNKFKSINSSALSLLYGPTLTSIHAWVLEKP